MSQEGYNADPVQIFICLTGTVLGINYNGIIGLGVTLNATREQLPRDICFICQHKGFAT